MKKNILPAFSLSLTVIWMLIYVVLTYLGTKVNFIFLNTVLVCWLIVFSFLVKTEKDPLTPPWILVAVLAPFFLIRPLIVSTGFSSGYFFEIGSRRMENEVLIYTMVVMVFAFLCYLLGYSSSKRISYKIAFRLPVLSGRWNRGLVNVIVIIVSLSSLISFFYLVFVLGGFSEILNKQAALVNEIPEGGFLSKLAWVIFNLYFIATMLLILSKPKSIIPLFHLLIGVAMVLFFGRRGSLLWLIIPYITYRHFTIKKYTLQQALRFGLVFFALMVLVLSFRLLTSAQSRNANNIAELLLQSAEYFPFDMAVSVIDECRSTSEYRQGLDFIPYFVRRAYQIDPNANYQSSGKALVAKFFPIFRAGIPPTLLGVFYMNFSIVGVLFGMFILGFISRVVKEYAHLSSDNNNVIILYGSILVFMFFFVRLGDIWLALAANGRILLATSFLLLVASNFRIKKRI